MYCPRCGSSQEEELRFCKLCGANLSAVRQVIDTRETEEKFDWGKTWVAEMFMSDQEAERRKLEMERRLGITPEMKRYREIKAGVITASVGIGAAIFLFFFMQGLILSDNVSTGAAEILSRVWMAGVIPLFVGIALIINGLIVSRKLVEIANRNQQKAVNFPEGAADPQSLPPANTTEFIPSNFSVTEETTKHLGNRVQKR